VEFEKQPQTRNAARKITLRQFTEEFEKLRTGPRGERLKASSVKSAGYALRRFARMIGDNRLITEVRKLDAIQFFNHVREEGLSPASVNKLKRTLRAAFQVAVDPCRLLPANPFTEIRSDRVARANNRYVTPAEFAALLQACAGIPLDRRVWWQAFLTVAYTAGLRYSEIVNLTWSDLDFGHETIHVRPKQASSALLEWTPKSYQSRSVPVPIRTMELLLPLLEACPEGHNYVFLPARRLALIKAAQTRGAWNEGQAILNNVRREFGDIVLQAAKAEPSLGRKVDGEVLAGVSIHDLRRSAITNWSKKINLQTLRDLAGHSNISTTVEYYAEPTEDQRTLARMASERAVACDENDADRRAPKAPNGGKVTQK
jgi:integrase